MKSDNKIIIVEPSPIVSAGLASYFDDCKQISIVSQLDRIDRVEDLSEEYPGLNASDMIKKLNDSRSKDYFDKGVHIEYPRSFYNANATFYNVTDVIKHKRRTDQPETDGADHEVHHVFHHDVACVLCPRQAGFHQGEPGLHHEHQDARDQRPDDV